MLLSLSIALLQAWCLFTVVWAPPPTRPLEELAESVSTDLRLGQAFHLPDTSLYLGHTPSSPRRQPDIGHHQSTLGNDLSLGGFWQAHSSPSRYEDLPSDASASSSRMDLNTARRSVGLESQSTFLHGDEPSIRPSIGSPQVVHLPPVLPSAEHLPQESVAETTSSIQDTSDTPYILDTAQLGQQQDHVPSGRHRFALAVPAASPVQLDDIFTPLLYDPSRPEELRLPPIMAYTRPPWLSSFSRTSTMNLKRNTGCADPRRSKSLTPSYEQY